MRLSISISKHLSVLLLPIALVAWVALPAAAQTQPPDMTQFGFPQVAATADFTPGQAATVTAGNQTVAIPADLLSKPVKFEFLTGDPSSFASFLEPDDQGKQIIAAFAFRVTDPATGQIVGKFDKPVTWSITDPRITSDSEVYNTTPANPPKVTANSAPGTVQGTTLSHPFGGAGVGWLVLGPPAPSGMPVTGASSSGTTSAMLILAALLVGSLTLVGGLVLRLKTKRIG